MILENDSGSHGQHYQCCTGVMLTNDLLLLRFLPSLLPDDSSFHSPRASGRLAQLNSRENTLHILLFPLFVSTRETVWTFSSVPPTMI